MIYGENRDRHADEVIDTVKDPHENKIDCGFW